VQTYKTAIQNINHSYTQIPCNSNNQHNTKFSKLHIFLAIWNVAAVFLLVNTQQHIQDTDNVFLLLLQTLEKSNINIYLIYLLIMN
jgi:hypothetical protein